MTFIRKLKEVLQTILLIMVIVGYFIQIFTEKAQVKEVAEKIAQVHKNSSENVALLEENIANLVTSGILTASDTGGDFASNNEEVKWEKFIDAGTWKPLNQVGIHPFTVREQTPLETFFGRSSIFQDSNPANSLNDGTKADSGGGFSIPEGNPQ